MISEKYEKKNIGLTMFRLQKKKRLLKFIKPK